jgi:hypothetical protein
VVAATLRQTADPYADLAPPQKRAFGATKVDHEFFFAAPTSDAAATFVIAVNERSGTTLIDDVQVFEVTATTVNPAKNLRFEVNTHSVAKTIALDGAYVDGKNAAHDGSLTLAPFSSAVLMKVP